MSANVLRVSGLKVAYGGVQAVKGIDFEVNQGELVTLIGANGAGKTTTLKAISGTLSASTVAGSIEYDGEKIGGMASHALVKKRLAMVPEGRDIFNRMSVRENLLMGAYSRSDTAEVSSDIDRWFGTFPRLRERQSQMAGTLSGGEQQMLAIARALMSRPKLLLMDEPSMGLAPIMVQTIFDVVRRISAQGITILLVEQNASMALHVANRGYVMESGLMTIHGASKELLVDPRVKAAYLGDG